MIDSKHQLCLNISPVEGESRVTFSQFTWLGLIFIAVCGALVKGSPLWLAGTAGIVFCLPVLVWLGGRQVGGSAIFDDLYLGAWGLVSLCAMALGGGALSPLTAVLVLGPLSCILLGRLQIVIHAAVLGLIAYALTILAGAFGWASVAPVNWQVLVPPLGIAALVQAVILVWAIIPHLRALQDGQRDEAETSRLTGPYVSSGAVAKAVQAARPTEQADLDLGLPLLLIYVASEGRIRRIEGADSLRWPDLVVGKMPETVLADRDGDVLTAPNGKTFHILNEDKADGAYWIGLVPEMATQDDHDTFEARLSEALENLEQAKVDLSDRTAFFAGLGHDLKTPLNAILGFADLMKAEVRGPLPDAYKDYPAIIHESGQDLMLLVDDILDLAKAEASGHKLDMEPIDLVASAASVVRQLEDQAERVGVKLSLKETAEVWAEADARAVRQIWQNLISNAIKYSQQGGTVTLSASKVSGAVALTVKDRGAGMDREDLAVIAKPFAQGSNAKGRAGTGLGLAVVHRFATLHGGKVVIDSEKGKGTQVRVTLPALDTSRLDGLEDAAQ